MTSYLSSLKISQLESTTITPQVGLPNKKRPLRSLFSSFSSKSKSKDDICQILGSDKSVNINTLVQKEQKPESDESEEMKTPTTESIPRIASKSKSSKHDKDMNNNTNTRTNSNTDTHTKTDTDTKTKTDTDTIVNSETQEEMPPVLSAYLGVQSLREMNSPIKTIHSSESKLGDKEAKNDIPTRIDTRERIDLTGKLTISTIRNLTNFLGESPFFQLETDRVYWVDILKGTLNYWHRITGQIGRWDLKQRIGCAIPIKNTPNTFMIGAAKGLALFDIQSEKWCHTYSNPEHHLITNRWNDGKCGPDGTLWIGSMNGFDTDKSLKEGLREGALYYLDGSVNELGERLKKRLDYIGISNGIAWSKSGLLMYFIDSSSQRVSEYHYLDKQSQLSTNRDKSYLTSKNARDEKRNNHGVGIGVGIGVGNSSGVGVGINIKASRLDLIVIPKSKGTPDGCAMDRDDNLWIALWNGGAIEQYSTIDGTLLNHVALPDRYVTSLTWFGPDLDKLFITTAMSDSLVEILDDLQKPQEERQLTDKGRVYVIDFSKTNIRGLPVNSFEMAKFRT